MHQKLYKALSEVKGEVETVIKTGRQVVQRQQTEQPQELDQRVTALKLLYNQLGAQVSRLPPGTSPTRPNWTGSSVVVVVNTHTPSYFFTSGDGEQDGAGEELEAVTEAAQGAQQPDGVAGGHRRRAHPPLSRQRGAGGAGC